MEDKTTENRLQVARLPSLPPLPSPCCTARSCQSTATLTSSTRRQETAELRRQWRQSRPRVVVRAVIKTQPVKGELADLDKGVTTSSSRLNTTTIDHHQSYAQHRVGHGDHGSKSSMRLPQLTNLQEIPPLHGHEVTRRPNYVFRVKLPPVDQTRAKWLPLPEPEVTTRRSRADMAKDTKYFFVSPEWDSERRTLERLRARGEATRLTHSWM